MKFLEVKCNNRIDPIGVGEHPVFSWKFRDVEQQQSYRIVVREGSIVVWDSGEVVSGRTCGVEYEGVPLKGCTAYSYEVTAVCGGTELRSGGHTFETALLGGFTARWLSYPSNYAGYALFARNVKTLAKKPRRARMYIAGIGYYEAYVNGKKVGRSVLNPGVTDYSKRILYDTWDVTALYREGENLTGVVLGNGWYGMQKLLCEIRFEFEDGTCDRIETNAQMDWFFTGSPITRQSIYGGECYDARREELVDGWDGSFRHINYFESGWMFSIYADEPAGRLVPQENERIEVTGTVAPVGVTELSERVRVYDMGVILAGWTRIRVRGARGARIVLKHAEGLAADGSVDRLNLRSAQAQDEYICKGGGEECWAPRFTYHGFRYVQAELEGEIELLSLTGEMVHSAVPGIGSFSCSDEILNRLHENVVRTEESNMHSIPTDCPQRDERFGWLNDLTKRLDQALMNFDVSLFYEKFAWDITDTQDARGAIGDTAPYKTGSRPADPVVVSYLLIPLRLYQRYGNARAAREQYGACKRWVDFLLGLAEGELLRFGIYGDWAPPEAYAVPGTPCNRLAEPELVSGAYLAWYCDILSRLAGILQKEEDAKYYARRAAGIRTAYNEAYFDAERGHYRNESQAANAIPLNLGICPEEYRESVAAWIADDVAAHGDHLTTGNQAYKHMLESLSDLGYSALMERMVVNPEYPGWGFMIRSGATSIWERWEAEMASEMNSFCHPMHGSIDAWFYGWLAGIRFCEDAVGADRLIIHPQLAELSWVDCSVETARGRAAVRWRRSGGETVFDVEIPCCTVAEFLPPCGSRIVSADGTPERLTLKTGSHRIVCREALAERRELRLPETYSPELHLRPVWNTREIYDEPVLFVGEEGEARLLALPAGEFVLRSASLDIRYEEGRDFSREARVLRRLPGSRIPYFTSDEYFRREPDAVAIGVRADRAEFPMEGPRYLKYGEGRTFTERQAAASYRTDEAFPGRLPDRRGETFSAFCAKAGREGASVLFYGDSITAGCNASGTAYGGNCPPHTPAWPDIVCGELERRLAGGPVACRNEAVGGWTSADGLAHFSDVLERGGADLLVLAFGMNDGGTDRREYRRNIEEMLRLYFGREPNGSALLVSCMLPNSQSDWCGNQRYFERDLEAIASRYPRTAVAPVTTLFRVLERTGKRNRDWLANNINHPNDFGVRLYAQVILRTLIGNVVKGGAE